MSSMLNGEVLATSYSASTLDGAVNIQATSSSTCQLAYKVYCNDCTNSQQYGAYVGNTGAVSGAAVTDYGGCQSNDPLFTFTLQANSKVQGQSIAYSTLAVPTEFSWSDLLGHPLLFGLLSSNVCHTGSQSVQAYAVLGTYNPNVLHSAEDAPTTQNPEPDQPLPASSFSVVATATPLQYYDGFFQTPFTGQIELTDERQCLTTTDAVTVSLAACSAPSSLSQLWSTLLGDPYGAIVSLQSGNCLTIEGSDQVIDPSTPDLSATLAPCAYVSTGIPAQSTAAPGIRSLLVFQHYNQQGYYTIDVNSQLKGSLDGLTVSKVTFPRQYDAIGFGIEVLSTTSLQLTYGAFANLLASTTYSVNLHQYGDQSSVEFDTLSRDPSIGSVVDTLTTLRSDSSGKIAAGSVTVSNVATSLMQSLAGRGISIRTESQQLALPYVATGVISPATSTALFTQATIVDTSQSSSTGLTASSARGTSTTRSSLALICLIKVLLWITT